MELIGQLHPPALKMEALGYSETLVLTYKKDYTYFFYVVKRDASCFHTMTNIFRLKLSSTALELPSTERAWSFSAHQFAELDILSEELQEFY
jgi:hypothetical protein